MENTFLFGLETEYILHDYLTGKVLWYEETPFKDLYSLLEEISLEGIPSLQGLDSEGAHDKILPYVVEGYHLKDTKNVAYDMHAKGVEIRSPICQSIDQCISVQKILYSRLEKALLKKNWNMTILSHHPKATSYKGPQANRPLHFWKWALRAMTTYGPDINISWHSALGRNLFLNKEDFEAKLNYYAPALVAFSSLSPFFNNSLVTNKDQSYVRSVRTIHRCEVAPLLEWHENENFRMEFKFFDMALSWEEFKLYFYFCLTLLTSEDLDKRTSLENGKKDLKTAANMGLESWDMRKRLLDILNAGEVSLPKFGFSTHHLTMARERLHRRDCPADYLIAAYVHQTPMPELMEILSHHYEKESDWISAFSHNLFL